MELISFEDALSQCKDTNKHVLLGNGFSMAYSQDMFSYKSLFDKADIETIYEELSKVFEILDTRDFEAVMNSLNSASAVSKIYGCGEDNVEKMNTNIEDLKNLLIDAITKTHPSTVDSIPSAKYINTRRFLSNFDSIFTTNYDLLLYWSLQNRDDKLEIDRTDGFNRPAGDTLTWDKANPQKSFYLHGAMHLYKEGADIIKIRYLPRHYLTEQVRDKIDKGILPIFVSEGTSKEKIIKIEENKYLIHCFETLKNIHGTLFIHGHSMSPNDDHIWDAVSENTSINNIFVSIHGDAHTNENKRIKEKAIEIAATAEAQLYLYDSNTANIW